MLHEKEFVPINHAYYKSAVPLESHEQASSYENGGSSSLTLPIYNFKRYFIHF
jgi:hypothetical protein